MSYSGSFTKTSPEGRKAKARGMRPRMARIRRRLEESRKRKIGYVPTAQRRLVKKKPSA